MADDIRANSVYTPRSVRYTNRLRLEVKRPIDLAAGATVGVCAVAFDWGLRSGFGGLAGATMFAVVAAGLASTGRFRNRQSLFALGAVPLFAIWLAIRSSGALLVPDVLTTAVLFGVAASFASGGSVFRLTVRHTVDRMVALSAHVLKAPTFIWTPLMGHLPRRLRSTAPVITGLLIVAPVLLVLVALLSSADSVFASLFTIRLNVGYLLGHLILLVIGGWLAAGFLRAASCAQVRTANVKHQPRTIEAISALAAVVALYVAFVLTQVVVWLGGAKHVLETQGLTYADHARQGFFQLVMVSAITLALIMTLKGYVSPTTVSQRRWWRACSLVAIALTLVIVDIAVQRLAMYEDAYGLTLLRLYATVAALWIGIVFLLLGYCLATGKQGHWFLAASTAIGLAMIFGLNIVNPARLIVERNVARHSSVAFDAQYAYSLSDDAVPALVKALPGLSDTDRAMVKTQICYPPHYDKSWTAANLSHSRAEQARSALC